MWGEMERSPALAAPGSNDFTGSDRKARPFRQVERKPEKFKPSRTLTPTIYASDIGYWHLRLPVSTGTRELSR